MEHRPARPNVRGLRALVDTRTDVHDNFVVGMTIEKGHASNQLQSISMRAFSRIWVIHNSELHPAGHPRKKGFVLLTGKHV